MDKSLIEELRKVQLQTQDLETKHSEVHSDLRKENLSLKKELDQLRSEGMADQAQAAQKFKKNCSEWAKIVEDMGKLTLGGASDTSEGKKLLQLRLTEQEQQYLEATEKFEEALRGKDETIEYMSLQLNKKNDQISSLDSENSKLRDKLGSLERTCSS